MKLRNKKTGKIIKLDIHSIGGKNYESLTEEWEDYEQEPKEYWFINASGEINSIYEDDEDEEDTKSCKEIGNYFDTREEAEKAVEKLKAIRKLKDYDLHIEWANTPEYDEDEDRWYCSVDFSVREGCNGDILFNLLFGGEE